MPNLVKANIKLPPPGDSKKLLECLTSAKHLSLCAIPSTVISRAHARNARKTFTK
ncbi:hypothetical protein YC2023_054829 [Brassica napus]